MIYLEIVSLFSNLLILYNDSPFLFRGRNNGQSSNMTGQILHFVHPKFSVILQMAGHFFLEKLEEFVRDALKALEIVRTTFKRMSHLSTDDNLITTLCSVYIQLQSIASCLINIEYYK